MTENATTNTQVRLGDIVGRWFVRRHASETKTTEDQNYSDIIQSLAGGSRVIFINSFPRSGNTWVRYLLSDIFQQRAGMATYTALPVSPERLIPDVYINPVATCERELTPGLFVKTHETFDRLKRRIPAGELRRCRHIYIIRSPEDSLVSFYYYHMRNENLRDKVRRGKDAFCLDRARDWISNAQSYLQAAEEGADVHFVSYENLLDNTAPVLGRMLDWLEVDYRDSMVRRAVANMQFDNMRMEEERGRPKAGEFGGRGGPGAGAAELQAETLARIRQTSASVMSEVKRHLSRQEEALGRRPAAPPAEDVREMRKIEAINAK